MSETDFERATGVIQGILGPRYDVQPVSIPDPEYGEQGEPIPGLTVTRLADGRGRGWATRDWSAAGDPQRCGSFYRRLLLSLLAK